jgi:hypothetical protein
VRQVTGTTGEGLTAKKAQRKWRFGRVYSSGCGDGNQLKVNKRKKQHKNKVNNKEIENLK